MVLRDAALEQLHRLPATPVEAGSILREFLAKLEELWLKLVHAPSPKRLCAGQVALHTAPLIH